MQNARRFQLLFLAFILAAATPRAVGQVTVATVPAATSPVGVAVNSTTNKTYVANVSCNSVPCPSPGTVTVIDGSTYSTATVTVGVHPYAVAVNPVTNKIYVANSCGNDLTCSSAGTVTVIDGATNNTATVNVGAFPYALAVNSVTNKIYVPNNCGSDPTCSGRGTVTVIDGATYNTATVNVGFSPYGVAVNSVTNNIYVVNECGNGSCSAATVTVVAGATNNTATVGVGIGPYFAAVDAATNKIYVPNFCGNDPTCGSAGTVTVIDGATNNTATVNAGVHPYSVAVNAVTDNIYVVNRCGNLTCSGAGTVTVIAGATNNTATVNVGVGPYSVAVDAMTNKIYVPNSCGNDLTCHSAGTVTAIDGATNNTVPVAVGDGPQSVAVNATTDTIYVPNYADGTVAVIGGNTKLQLVNVSPCRLVDTRQARGVFGGPSITGGTSRSFPIPQNTNCNIPTSAAAYSLNVTVVPHTSLGYLTIWPTPETQPVVSTLNSPDGRIKANAAIVPAGVSGAVSVYVTDTADLVLDIDGYFAPATSSTYQFYRLTPCRLVDTRSAQGELGGPRLQAQSPRDFPLLSSACIPSGLHPLAYSLNFTVVPSPSGQPLGYLSVWPAGESQPVVSTLNNPTATVVANAAIVPAGTNGDIDVYAYNTTDLLIDIDGYFAAPETGGLSMYPVAPCRVLDTRQNNGQPFVDELAVNVVGSSCAPPSGAEAYIFNATVVPPGFMPYLSLWPDDEQQPVVSTLNAYDGFIASDMAIVPTNNGSIDAFAYALTQLVLDISGYFAR